MNDPSATGTLPHEKEVEIAREWLHENGDNVSGIEQKLLNDSTGASTIPQRSIIVKRKAKRKDDRPFDIVCSWVVQHQIGLAVNLLMLLGLTHMCFPRARQHTRKFFELSYHNPKTGEYRAGWNDACLVSFWIVVFTGLRAAIMDYVLIPFSRNHNVKTERDQTRFAEQAWLLIYYSVFWTIGMYILVNSPYWLNMKELWTNWPVRELGAAQKWYFLVQYAFWLQQIMVINIEARRKDHWQMFTHHIVTTLLIFTSYCYHQSRVGNLILCLMDVVDIILPTAKCLKYMGYSRICDVLFGIFMLTWIAARHVLFLIACYSLYADVPIVIDLGCYRGSTGNITGPFPPPDLYSYLVEPFIDPEGVVCFDNGIKWCFLSALLFLQGITIMWFCMIVRVASQVIRGKAADDTRSDDEGAAEDEIDQKIIETIDQLDDIELPPYEEEVGAESISLRGRAANASRYRKSHHGNASGVSLPVHTSDRKELLGRIGCDKGV